MPRSLTIRVLPGTLAICRLAADAPVPGWATGPGFMAIVRTQDELSVICDGDAVPGDVTAERGWCVLQLCGPFDFALVGILLSVATPLAEADVSIMPVATYDTDYVLVRSAQVEAAVAALRAAGHAVLDHPSRD